MVLVVQRVAIVYGKAHRGMPGAEERANLPRAFALWPSADGYVLQVHSFRARKDALAFEHTAEKYQGSRAFPERVREGALVVRVKGRSLEVAIEGRQGAPSKRQKLAPLSLAMGGYGRAITNHRSSGHWGQAYFEDTFNVALLEEIDIDIFQRKEPDAVLDDRADLF
jgi:hypothetical protein